MEKYNGWDELFAVEFKKEYFQRLSAYISSLPQEIVFPPKSQRLSAFMACRPEQVKVVIIGQDPYHNVGQANGLSFSVDITPLPPSLKNIFKELSADIGGNNPLSGDLMPWARQGVLLLNSALSVEAHKAGSHSKIGWQYFTDAVIKHLNDNYENLVYIIWGAHAHKKCLYIENQRNCVLISSHPSPLSNTKPFGAYPPFSGSRPFSKANDYLQSIGKTPIEWRLEI